VGQRGKVSGWDGGDSGLDTWSYSPGAMAV